MAWYPHGMLVVIAIGFMAVIIGCNDDSDRQSGERITKPYGSWTSPVTTGFITAGAVQLGPNAVDDDDIYWAEGRPEEGGRSVVVRRMPDDTRADMLDAPFSAKTGVHEYGGGAFGIHAGVMYFSNKKDRRLYRCAPGEDPRPITPEGDRRFGEFDFDHLRNRLVCIMEDHTGNGEYAENVVVAVDADGGGITVLASGNDFVCSPRTSPDGSMLAWYAWDHPAMPWDGCELFVADINQDGSLANTRHIAGGSEESIYQPEWSPDGVLYFVSDRTNWWNLYRWDGDTVEPVATMDAEFGIPLWYLGMTLYGFTGPETIVAACTAGGLWRLVRIDTTTGDMREYDLPYTVIGNVTVTSDRVIFAGATPTEPIAIVSLDPETGKTEILRRSIARDLDPGYVSHPEAVSFATGGGETAHGFFYPPANRNYRSPEGELPPLLVMSHGGPTGAFNTGLDPRTQYWTSRGLAVLKVNYRGSTGYGRRYRNLIRERWGEVDLEDCERGVDYFVAEGIVDGDRIGITGGSAGGYTTLCAMTFSERFNVGASHYGVSDLEGLTLETHKYEARYLDSMVGPYPARKDVYIARSPIHFADRITTPLILFQGLDDKVVLPNQAETIFESMKTSGGMVAYFPFEGEGHGFVRAENITRSLEAELYFYSLVFGFKPADDLPLVDIFNNRYGDR